MPIGKTERIHYNNPVSKSGINKIANKTLNSIVLKTKKQPARDQFEVILLHQN